MINFIMYNYIIANIIDGMKEFRCYYSPTNWLIEGLKKGTFLNKATISVLGPHVMPLKAEDVHCCHADMYPVQVHMHEPSPMATFRYNS